MSRIALLALTMWGIAALSGCVTERWTYGKTNYPSSVEAIEAARQDIDARASAVPARNVPLAKSALLLTPSIQSCRQVVVTHGAASDELVRYVATVAYYSFYGMAEGLEHRKTFSSLHIEEFAQRDPPAHPDYDYIIWLRLDGPDSAKWMIAPGKDTSLATPLYVSPISDPGDRLSKFIDSVEEYVTHPVSNRS
jgi:hypothetical protein